MMFDIFSSPTWCERGLIRDCTRAGLGPARARGWKRTCKPISPDDRRVRTATRTQDDRGPSTDKICVTLKNSRPTFYRRRTSPDVTEERNA